MTLTSENQFLFLFISFFNWVFVVMQIQCTWTYRDLRLRPTLFSTFSKHLQTSIGYVATRGGRGTHSFVATMSSVSTPNDVVSTVNTQRPLQVLLSSPYLLVSTRFLGLFCWWILIYQLILFFVLFLWSFILVFQMGLSSVWFGSHSYKLWWNFSFFFFLVDFGLVECSSFSFCPF